MSGVSPTNSVSQVDELNRRHAIDQSLRFQPGRGGLIVAELAHASGYTSTVALNGAHIMAWHDPSGNPILFLSEGSNFKPGTPIRGGIPIVFPQFAKDGEMACSHGFARIAPWQVSSTEKSSTDELILTLALESNEFTKQFWPGNEFEVLLRITLGQELTTELVVYNRGLSEFSFANAFHTYFAVTDIAETEISGVQNLSYIDKMQSNSKAHESRQHVKISEATDRIYLNAPADLEVIDSAGGRKIQIQKRDMSDAVIWNPWTNKLSDLCEGDYRHMVCVESGNVGSKVILKPTEEFRCSQKLTCKQIVP